ncbi:MAG: hypothetical protein FJ029_09245 [Actinobacteria bacterium]|nr:hypothetical protein [Actinomycetota bacterium]
MNDAFEFAFRAPIPHPNALQATAEGLWVADERTGRVYLVDPRDGAILRTLATGAGKTSGLAYGSGALWIDSNGLPAERPLLPTDTPWTRIVKADPTTGATLTEFRAPWDSDVHGLEWTHEGLWLTTLAHQSLTLVDPLDFRVVREIPVPHERAHGLAWEGDRLWCAHTNQRLIVALDPRQGEVLERIEIPQNLFEPHGLTIWAGVLWSCDAVSGAIFRRARGGSRRARHGGV